MPPISDLVIVLPCESLDDFPTHHHDPEATSLLCCWTGLWHPALINEAQQVPQIQSAHATETVWLTSDSNSDSDSDSENRPCPLLVVPAIGADPLASDMLMAWSIDSDPVLVEQPLDRETICSRAACESPSIQTSLGKISEATVADFYALGYGYLQLQLMTRKLRYSSNLNEAKFLTALTDAAKSALAGDNNVTREKLFACFDLLLEEKNCYYPVEPQLCEILLLHDNTIGTSLNEELQDTDRPINILLDGQLAKKLAAKNPGAVEQIKSRLTNELACLLGGLENEIANELVSSDTWVNQLKFGRETLNRIFGQPPNAFARRQFGLNPTTPNILQKFGYAGVVHANFSTGQIPDMGNGIMRWDGDDSESVLAVSEKPMDAADSGTFLRLSIRLGEMIDSVHTATGLLVHWPNKTCLALQDLKRIASFVPLFGNFVTLDQLFDEAYDPGYGQSFSADEYKSPHLTNALTTSQTNPISRHTDYWRRRHELETIRRLVLIAACWHNLGQADLAELQKEICELQNRIEFLVGNSETDGDAANSTDERLQALFQQSKNLLHPESPVRDSAAALVVNVQSRKTRVVISPDSNHVPKKLPTGTVRDKAPVLFAANSDAGRAWVLELPAFGQAMINWQDVNPKDQFKKDPALVTDLELQNEFFRVLIDSKSGGIKSVRKHLGRTNLVGQQLSIRLPAQHHSRQRYATMVADRVQAIDSQALTAAIHSQGRLVAGEHTLAEYSQIVRVTRGINRIEIEGQVKLCQPLFQPLTANSRNHYLCSRLAWKSEAARLFSNILDSQMQVSNEWFHGTQYITIKDESSVTLLTGGLPFHRRPNRRMLDSVLMIGNESIGEYSFALDVDQNYPAAAAAERLSPVVQIATDAKSPRLRPWCFHLSRKNVLVTFAEPIFDAGGTLAGAAFRLKETESRATELEIRSFRDLQSAEIVGFNGEPISTLEVTPEDQSKIKFRIEPLSYFEIRLYFPL
jgi:alpha-mannosidase